MQEHLKSFKLKGYTLFPSVFPPGFVPTDLNAYEKQFEHVGIIKMLKEMGRYSIKQHKMLVTPSDNDDRVEYSGLLTRPIMIYVPVQNVTERTGSFRLWTLDDNEKGYIDLSPPFVNLGDVVVFDGESTVEQMENISDIDGNNIVVKKEFMAMYDV
jgi:hypothetical protein